ncbi:No apical meristem (NAM) protein [Artemisia annua]|uniref:No apical meristem (NAM) protein n=1 Tax=Artemisia annua TaxID=35608 RepID=A0A2U1PAR6_ARTAN|nr:No apical meristem (NAM) protein [Artemisia annua]
MADNNNVNLPPGFRFCPTDEELVVHFLQRKASLLPYHPDIIPDLDLYPFDPWDLDGKAMAEGKKWYYYSRRTQNRITTNGYWKSLGCDEQIISSSSSKRVGVKKYYVFHIGEAPDEGVKTNWIMQEFRLSDGSSSSSSSGRSKRKGQSKTDFSKWVICRVFEHSCDNDDDGDDDNDGIELSCLDEVFLSLDDFDDVSFPN